MALPSKTAPLFIHHLETYVGPEQTARDFRGQDRQTSEAEGTENRPSLTGNLSNCLRTSTVMLSTSTSPYCRPRTSPSRSVPRAGDTAASRNFSGNSRMISFGSVAAGGGLSSVESIPAPGNLHGDFGMLSSSTAVFRIALSKRNAAGATFGCSLKSAMYQARTAAGEISQMS